LSLLLAATLATGAVRADDLERARTAAVQRLDWAGLSSPDIEIDVDATGIATVTGSVPSDIVRDEVVRTVELTAGIRGVVDRLDVRR